MSMRMNDLGGRIRASHLDRAAYVYVRQSSPGQVDRHKEGRLRQYQASGPAISPRPT
jgi:hypothetical protein